MRKVYCCVALLLLLSACVSSSITPKDEVLALDRDLKIMASMWENMRVLMLVIQGTKDGLVDPRHADFAEGLKTQANIEVARVEGAGHLVHIDREVEVNRLIIHYVKHL